MTGEIRKILVAMSGNNEKDVALEYGADLSSILKARLDVIHVIEEVLTYQIWGALVAKEEIDKQKSRIERRAGELQNRLGLDVGTTTTVGVYPAVEILKEFHGRGYDLLVIGSHGPSSLMEVLLGGVSSEVVHHTRKPVVVVRKRRNISRILMYASGSKCSFDAIRFAMSIAKAAKADVTVLAVSKMSTGDSIGRAQEIARIGTEILRKQGVKAKEMIRVGKPAEVILAEARELDSDLIVIGATGRPAIAEMLMGEVTSKVMHGSTCPVLVFRE